MRQAARIALDPLWQCLCPSWTFVPITRPAQSLARARHPVLQCRSVTSASQSQEGQQQAKAFYNPHNIVINPLQQPESEHLKQTVLDGRVYPRKPPRPSFQPPPPSRDYTSETTPRLYLLLQTLAIDGKVNDCRHVVETLIKGRLEKPNLNMYRGLILSNVDHEHGAAWRVTELLEDMTRSGIPPDAAVCHAALKVYGVHPDHLMRADVLEYMKKRWFQLSPDGMHDVVAGLLREGLLEQALEHLEEMRKQGVKASGWLLDMAVYVLCDVDEVDEASDIVRSRFEAGDLDMSRTLWWNLLEVASNAHHYEATSLVWTSHVNTGHFNPPSGTCLNVLATAAHNGDTVLATDVFSHLAQRGTPFKHIHYELLINAYVRLKTPDLRRAFTILTVMELERVEPSAAETRSLFDYLTRNTERLPECLPILRELYDQGRKIPLAALNLLIECYAHHHRLEEALKIYKQIHTFVPAAEGARKSFANEETFNHLFKACRQISMPATDTAGWLVNELLSLQVMPSAMTYDRLILVYLQAYIRALNKTPAGAEVLPREFRDEPEGFETLPEESTAQHKEPATQPQGTEAQPEHVEVSPEAPTSHTQYNPFRDVNDLPIRQPGHATTTASSSSRLSEDDHLRADLEFLSRYPATPTSLKENDDRLRADPDFIDRYSAPPLPPVLTSTDEDSSPGGRTIDTDERYPMSRYSTIAPGVHVDREPYTLTTKDFDCLMLAYRYFDDMYRGASWLPRIGTIQLLCLCLAGQRLSHAWMIYNIADENSHKIAGWNSKRTSLRKQIDQAWIERRGLVASELAAAEKEGAEKEQRAGKEEGAGAISATAESPPEALQTTDGIIEGEALASG